jgi:hypothetical protein
MAGAALFPYDGAMRRSDERRLSVALAVSLLVHAIAIAALRGSLPITYAYSEGTASSLGLQAILAGPAHEPVPEEPAPSEPAIDTSLLSPPAASPLEPPREETPPATAPAPGSGPWPRRCTGSARTRSCCPGWTGWPSRKSGQRHKSALLRQGRTTSCSCSGLRRPAG